MNQSESISRLLIGSFYFRFSVSATTFHLEFEDFVLASQDIISPNDAKILSTFLAGYPPASFTTNPDFITKSAILAACLGIQIRAVEVLDDSTLSLEFENNIVIQLPTNTSIVDWHWAISEGERDPYVDSYIICTAPAIVEGSVPDKLFKKEV